MDSQCIICMSMHVDQTVEHIIPSSLGNEYYVLPKGKVCHTCNNRFAKVENKVVSSNEFVNERVRLKKMTINQEMTLKPLRNEDMIKLMIKMSYEALYISRNKIWKSMYWRDVLDYLINGKEIDVASFTSYDTNESFKSIPRWLDWFRLKNNSLSLEYAISGKSLLTSFQYGRLRTTILVAKLHP